MEEQRSIRFQIKEVYKNLRTSEQTAADYVLNEWENVDQMSLTSLSQKAGVSQPTVIRFVKAVGYGGFKEFKYALIGERAKQRAASNPVQSQDGCCITPKDSWDKVLSKTIAYTQMLMEDTMKEISASSLLEAVKAIKRAKLVDICGVENSGAAVTDLTTKLLYLGIRCRSFPDSYLQRISAGNLTWEDTIIAFSYSGSSREIVDILKKARHNKTATIVITNHKDSPVCQYGDIVLPASHEKFLTGDVLFSRTAQIAISDMIYTGIILSDYEHYSQQLKRGESVLKDDFK